MNILRIQYLSSSKMVIIIIKEKQTNPRGELAGERLDDDFDLAVSSLSNVSSLATSTS